MRLQKRFYIALSSLFLVVITFLMLLEAYINVVENKNRSDQTAQVLMNQIENIIFTNQENEERFVEQLKNDYITRARAASYIFENHINIIRDVDEIKKIAKLISVDEIHLFDTDGVIFAGSVPKYYGVTMDDGTQIRFFKPMLSDRNLSLCQDLRPNTAEEKSMMYAMVWMENGESLVQIGIESTRLLEEMRSNEISEVVSNMPAYDGIQIIVADKNTKVIQGSSNPLFNEKNLEDIGVNIGKLKTRARFSSKVSDVPCFCSVKEFQNHIILIAHDQKILNSNIRTSLLSFFIYMFVVALFMVLTIRKIEKIVSTEKTKDEEK